MKRETTLGRRANEDLAVTLRIEIQTRADQARASFEGIGGEHISALQALHDYLSSVRVEDPRMVALSVINERLGKESTFEPTLTQASLLARVGQGFTPAPEITLSELVSAGLEDLVEALADERATAKTAQERAVENERQFKQPVERAEATEKELAEARELIEGLQAELQEANGQLAYLSDYVASSEGGTPKAKDKKPRRKKVGDHTGVYETQLAESPEETIYEISWQETGKRRWRMVGPDLAEAIALRKEITEGVTA